MTDGMEKFCLEKIPSFESHACSEENNLTPPVLLHEELWSHVLVEEVAPCPSQSGKCPKEAFPPHFPPLLWKGFIMPGVLGLC